MRRAAWTTVLLVVCLVPGAWPQTDDKSDDPLQAPIRFGEPRVFRAQRAVEDITRVMDVSWVNLFTYTQGVNRFNPSVRVDVPVDPFIVGVSAPYATRATHDAGADWTRSKRKPGGSYRRLWHGMSDRYSSSREAPGLLSFGHGQDATFTVPVDLEQATPSRIRSIDGELRLLVADELRVVDLPVAVTEDWTAVTEGLRVRVQRIADPNGEGRYTEVRLKIEDAQPTQWGGHTPEPEDRRRQQLMKEDYMYTLPPHTWSLACAIDADGRVLRNLEPVFGRSDHWQAARGGELRFRHDGAELAAVRLVLAQRLREVVVPFRLPGRSVPWYGQDDAVAEVGLHAGGLYALLYDMEADLAGYLTRWRQNPPHADWSAEHEADVRGQ